MLLCRALTVFICLSLADWARSAAPEPNRVVFLAGVDAPPYLYTTESGNKGALLDVVRRLIAPLGRDLDVVWALGGRDLSQALAGHGDLLLVNVFADVSLSDYPDDLLICPNEVAEIPVSLYSFSPEHSLLSKDALIEKKIGLMRIPSAIRGFTRKYGLKDVERYKSYEHVFRALMAGRIDLALADKYSIHSLALKNKSERPIQLSMDLGVLKPYLAIPKSAEARLGIFEALCVQAAKAREQAYFNQAITAYFQ